MSDYARISMKSWREYDFTAFTRQSINILCACKFLKQDPSKLLHMPNERDLEQESYPLTNVNGQTTALKWDCR